MENTEATQLALKPITASSDTVFARGNRIVDPELLRRLTTLAPLPSAQVANLALFVSLFYGNRPLAFHVAELALLSIATRPNVPPPTELDLADWWEDLCDGGDEPPDGVTPQPIAKSANNEPPLPQLFAVPLLPGLVLLVESQTRGEETSYFAIGVSPNPATIPPLT